MSSDDPREQTPTGRPVADRAAIGLANARKSRTQALQPLDLALDDSGDRVALSPVSPRSRRRSRTASCSEAEFSGLRTSWAKPAARVPTAARRSARMRPQQHLLLVGHVDSDRIDQRAPRPSREPPRGSSEPCVPRLPSAGDRADARPSRPRRPPSVPSISARGSPVTRSSCLFQVEMPPVLVEGQDERRHRLDQLAMPAFRAFEVEAEALPLPVEPGLIERPPDRVQESAARRA